MGGLAQQCAQPLEEAVAASSSHKEHHAFEPTQVLVEKAPPDPTDNAAGLERIEVTLEAEEHPWNWSKAR
jgi:hypothetical protein